MRLIRTPTISMLTDGLDFEDDDGTITRVAEPNSGYFSASGYSSHNDVVYRWSARLYRGPSGAVVVLETWETQADETRSTACYVRDASGSFSLTAPVHDLADAPVVSAVGD